MQQFAVPRFRISNLSLAILFVINIWRNRVIGFNANFRKKNFNHDPVSMFVHPHKGMPSVGVKHTLSMSSSSITCVSGRKCILLPSRSSKDNNSNEKNPPLVLLGGMAQTISSWEHHLYPLSRDRDVFMYECYGQGLGCHDTIQEKVGSSPNMAFWKYYALNSDW